MTDLYLTKYKQREKKQSQIIDEDLARTLGIPYDLIRNKPTAIRIEIEEIPERNQLLDILYKN